MTLSAPTGAESATSSLPQPCEGEAASETPIWDWFGLTRAAYLVLPRLALQAMPLDFQRRFVSLMEEWEAAGIQTPSYHVLRDDRAYTREVHTDPDDETSTVDEYHVLQTDEWSDYRRGDAAALQVRSGQQ